MYEVYFHAEKDKVTHRSRYVYIYIYKEDKIRSNVYTINCIYIISIN